MTITVRPSSSSRFPHSFVRSLILIDSQYAQMEALEDLAEASPDRVQILKKAAVTKLIKEGDKVVGVEYTHGGENKKAYGPVVIATGKLSMLSSEVH